MFVEWDEDGNMFDLRYSGFKHLNAAGMSLLLDRGGVFDRLLQRLATDVRDGHSVEHAMEFLLHIAQSDDGAHASLLTSRGIVGKLTQLLRDCVSDFVRSKVCVVLAAVLRRCTPVDMDSVVQGGLISVLVAFFPPDACRGHTAVRVLTYLCLRGNDAHRRALVVGGALPLLTEVAQRRTYDSAASRPDRRDLEEIDARFDPLRPLERAPVVNGALLWVADAAQVDPQRGVLDFIEWMNPSDKGNETAKKQNNTCISATTWPELQIREEINAIIDLLRALRLLLRMAKSMEEEATYRGAPVSAKSERITRAQFEPLLRHWYPGVRDELFKLMREHVP
jgi:hypothetical protein